MKTCLVLFLILCSFAFTPISINTEETGEVVKIIDGDTFDLLTAQKKLIRIRMNAIDCPERRQDFYQSAKNALAAYIFRKQVRVVITGQDRNKRSIATVFYDEKNINLEMIRNGYAWHYKKYSSDPVYAKAEQQARSGRRGLWSRPHPTAPWDFRKK